MTTAVAPVVEVAHRTNQEIPTIRQVLRKIPEVAKERKQVGLPPVINLCIGQPHMAMNPVILPALQKRLAAWQELPPQEQAQVMGYTHAAGMPRTRQVVARFFQHCYPEVGEITQEGVMVSHGAAGAMTYALQTLINSGDRVVVFAPYFGAYKSQVEGLGGELVTIPLDPKGASMAESLRHCLENTSSVKAVIWNDPNNPLGFKVSCEELNELGAVFRAFPNVMILHDEVYRDIVHCGEPCSLLNVYPELFSRSVVIRSFAKDLAGAPALRGSIVAAPTHLATSYGREVNFLELMANQQLIDIVSINIFTQEAIIAALEAKMSGESAAWETTVRKEYRENVAYLSAALEEVGLPPLWNPEGAFFIAVDASLFLGKAIPDSLEVLDHCYTGLHRALEGEILESDKQIATLLLLVAGVAVVPLSGFGIDGTTLCGFRVSCAVLRPHLEEGVERLRALIKKLE